MASNVLEMIIKAEDQFTSTFYQFETSLNRGHYAANYLVQPMSGATQAVMGFAAALGAAGAAMEVMAATSAVKAESAMADLKKLFDGTAEELKTLEATAEGFSVKYGTSFENAARGMAAWAAEGKNVADIQTGLLAAQKLAIAGNIQEGDAADRLSAIMAALGGNFNYVHHVVDGVNAVANAFATSESNITLGLKEFVGVGKQQNLTLDQMIGLFTGVDIVTKNAGESGNALKTILVKLHEESKDSAAAWKILGLAHSNAAGSFKNSYTLLQQMADKWPTLTQTQQQFISSTFAGLYHISKFNLVMQNMDTVTKATATSLDSLGSADKEVETRLNTTEFAIKRVVSNFQILMKHIGGEQTGALKESAKGFAALVEAIDHWNTATHATGNAFNEFLKPAIDAFQKSLDTLAQHFPEVMAKVDFAPLKKSLHDLSDALGKMLGMDFSSVNGWAAAIQKVVDASAALVNTLRGITTVLGGFARAGVSAIEFLNALSPTMQAGVGYAGALALAFTALNIPLRAGTVTASVMVAVYQTLSKAVAAQTAAVGVETAAEGVNTAATEANTAAKIAMGAATQRAAAFNGLFAESETAATGATAANTAATAANAAAAETATAATGRLGIAATALNGALGVGALLGTLYLVYKAYDAWNYKQEITTENTKKEAEQLARVNAAFNANYTSVDSATKALHDQNMKSGAAATAAGAHEIAIARLNSGLETMTQKLADGTTVTVTTVKNFDNLSESTKALLPAVDSAMKATQQHTDKVAAYNDVLAKQSGMLSTTVSDLERATQKVAENSAAMAELEKHANIKISTDSSALDKMREAFQGTASELSKSAAAVGSVQGAGSGIAGQILNTEQQRLGLAKSLYQSETGLNDGMKSFTQSFNGAQDKLTGAVTTAASKFDAVTRVLGQDKVYNVNVNVAGGGAAVSALVEEVLARVVTQIKQENTLAISTG